MAQADLFNEGAATAKQAEKTAAQQAAKQATSTHKGAKKPPQKVATGSAPAGSSSGGGAGRTEHSEEDNARRFVVAKGRLARFCESLGGWHVWHEPAKAWVADPKDVKVIGLGRDMVSTMLEDARRYVGVDPVGGREWIKWANRSSTSGAISSMLRLARRDLEAVASDFDADPRAVACGGRLIRLEESGSVIERDIKVSDLCRHNTGVQYEPAATHSAWDSFLETFLPDKVIRQWVQAYAGYSLLGGNPERKFVIIRGETTSGKTFFLNCLYRALGSYAGTFGLQMLRAKQDSDLNPGLIRTASKRFAYVEESGDAWHLHVDEMKRLTGDGMLQGRLPFASAPVEMEAAFTPWMATNDIPTIEGADRALKRRLVFIPFSHSLSESEEKTDLRSVTASREFREAVLRWAVDGWRLYRAEGLEVPAEAVEFNMQLRSELNHFELFVAEVCVLDSDAWVVPAELYAAYRAWCEDSGLTGREVYTMTKFGRLLTANGIGGPNDRQRVDGVPVRIRRGIRLQS